MLNNQAKGTNNKSEAAEKSSAAAPTISLPKGGGAIRGIGEKFAANPVTGTGSMSVPIATSPGRSGFGPQLSLSYDSGAGNGPFGFGWSLSLPAITRKTDKGLPQYRDAEESDVFILSGAEDLVPEFERDQNGNWVLENGKHKVHDKPRTINGVTYNVRRYRPRIEGLFARIERWTNQADPQDTFWRSISKDNITTWYGKGDNSRIADPADPTRIFNWLICESYDDKGNVIVYRYKAEDSAKVDLSQAHERNRTPKGRSANRYLKYIRYGNHQPYYPKLAPDQAWPAPPGATDADGSKDWFFEVVFDYGEHHAKTPTPGDTGQWDARQDPFSSYRAGFEVRTYRLCQRVLMFHHFENENGVGKNCLVRSTDFTYSYEQDKDNARNPIYTFLREVTQSGYKRAANDYLKRSLPPVVFEYTLPAVQDVVEEVDPQSLENLPIGLDGAAYQWTDLHGEGIPGILTEQAGAWFYKRNLSPINEKRNNGTTHVKAKFAPVELVAVKPNLALAGGAQFMDLAGDGLPDLVVLDDPMPGLYEHDGDESWQTFRPFTSRLNRDTRDPNLKFVDLDGDGHADVLITEDDAFVWHPSLAEAGFGPARCVAQALDEEKGPRLVFADGTQSIYLADLSGDGLTDLVRIRNGEVCYWPNLGYARFGAKVTMDHAPHFDHPDQFDHKRIRLADIDGTGTTDIIYLHRDGVRLYFNQSGNSWSQPQVLRVFPRVDELVAITPVDLLGNGTACLVWSSPLPGDACRPMRYVNLMGREKPHLLVRSVNNLGAETRVQYAPSTKFYLQDKRNGKPWITRLPFPVHVVERVETFDRISRNRFVTRYAYHHGYFDGEEREFRGFGMVEQFDTEEFAALNTSGELSDATNIDAASHMPTVVTKTWFHTGVYLGRDRISNFFAGLLDEKDTGEYYREPAWRDDDVEARKRLLDDTILLAGLPLEEEREACRAIKGSMLRQEVYALDGTAKAEHPYTVTEQNFTIKRLQPREGNRHAVFFIHPREAISYHYERNPADPRIGHAVTLEVDAFGNALRSVAVAYPRADVPERTPEQNQTQTHVTLTLNRFANRDEQADWYRVGLPVETRTYEVVKTPAAAQRFSFGELSDLLQALVSLQQHEPPQANVIPYEQWDWREKWNPQTEPGGFVNDQLPNTRLRLIEHLRTLYRKDDLSALSPLGDVESLALPGESYKLALTPDLVASVFKRKRPGQPDETLIPMPAPLLEGTGADQGGYVALEGNWWIPTGRVFFDPVANATAAQELATARQHFFLPRKFADPFGHTTVVDYDAPYDLLMVSTSDALNNTVAASNDYRVLQPKLVTDPNGNRAAVAFDALGMVVGTAVMGKVGENKGDLLDHTFVPDLDEATTLAHLNDPLNNPHSILQKATTRLVYDLFAYQRTKNSPQPAVVYTLARETHHFDLAPGQQTRVQHSFSYSDGFGREIQKKIQAEPEKINGVPGPPRWVGSGWTIFNNKGKPVRQYEPFFTGTHRFEFGVQVGVSPILFYDPVERVVATLHPNHTYEKVVFDPWRQTTYDVNDTVLNDPATDDDIKGFTAGYFASLPASPPAPAWQTWYQARINGAKGAHEKKAAEKAAAHANTPTTAYFDTLGRPFLTVAHNKVACPNHELDGTDDKFHTRVELDIEGNQRAVRDAFTKAFDAQGNEIEDPLGRIVMRYDYDMLGNRIHQASMEAGERWMLNDVTGKPIRAWDSRAHTFRINYDPLRRPLRSFVTGADPNQPNQELLTERLIYGEQHPEAELRNLRGVLYLHFDQAGVVANEAHDFKGNLLRASRRLATVYKKAIDWRTVDAVLPASATDHFDQATLEAALSPLLEAETYSSRTSYDALNRPIQLIAPRSDQPGARRNVIQPVYNEANLLERVHVWLDHSTEPTGLLDANTVAPSPVGVKNIDYDAKGQRLRIDYKNGATTRYAYDPETFRLIHLYTQRDTNAFADDCPQPPPADWPGCQVQNLHYTYDPVGNITHIQDDAQQKIYFKNKRIEPSADYTYDAIYRLIEATGREHLGQVGGASIPHSHDDAQRIRRPHPNDGKAMSRYCEKYVYDAVGNFIKTSHHLACPDAASWTRTYAYNEASLIEPAKRSNRLSSTTVGSGNPITEQYGYDSHGNMTRMPQLQIMQWDYRDQLSMSQRQKVNDEDVDGIERHGERTYYIYDAVGQRVRKITELANGSLKDERIYLGGFEIYRQHSGTHAGLVRETLHIMDDKQRIALVENRNNVDDRTPKQLIRYQLGNHLGSASMELDDQAQIISYEEYTPYGSTSYQAVRSQTETPKRYRYTGMERDEESGLNYHSARYYAPWLGRWVCCDPSGIESGINPCLYSRNNPTTFYDTNGMVEFRVDGKYFANSREYIKYLNAKEAKAKVFNAKTLPEREAALKAYTAAENALEGEKSTTDFHTNVGFPTVLAAGALAGGAPAVAATSGSAALAGTLYGGFVLGGAFSAGRQGAEMSDGTRQSFSWMEVLEGGGWGGALAPATMSYVPVRGGMLLLGIASGMSELQQGHAATGVFDLATAVVPEAIWRAKTSKFTLSDFVARLDPRNYAADALGTTGSNFLFKPKVKFKTLKEWLKGEPELLKEMRELFKKAPEWQGIDPDSTLVAYRPRPEVAKIRAKADESPGHHPHPLALHGPEGQKLTLTGDDGKFVDPRHSYITGLTNRVIGIIKKASGY